MPSTSGRACSSTSSDDPEEPIYIYADPDGHPFCIFVMAGDP